MSTEDRLATIRALLAKAERTTYPEEAKAFAAKAEELMVKWAIDDAMLAQSGSRAEVSASIDATRIWLPANEYRAPKVALLAYVASNHGCKVVREWQRYRCPVCEGEYRSNYPCPRDMAKTQRMFPVVVVGFEQDRAFTELLFTSLLIQAEREFESEQVYTSMVHETGSSNRTGGHRIAWRNAFMNGYADTIGRRLGDARRRARREAEQTHGAPGVALALRDKDTLVKQRYEELFPRLRTSRSTAGNHWGSGYGLGRDAGGRADLGQPRVGGSRRAIGDKS